MTDVVVSYTGWDATGVTWGYQAWGIAVGNASLVGTGEIGDVTVTGDALELVTDLKVLCDVGTVTVDATTNVSVTGVYATGDVGTVTQRSANIIPVTGTSSTVYLGSVTTTQGATAVVTGVSATGQIGYVNIWNPINDYQNANWRRIAA